MNKVRFELNLSGLNEIMKSSDMQRHLNDVVSQVRGVAGGNYGGDVVVASYEAIGRVYPTDAESAKDNLENNTLEKSLGGLPRTKR